MGKSRSWRAMSAFNELSLVSAMWARCEHDVSAMWAQLSATWVQMSVSWAFHERICQKCSHGEPRARFFTIWAPFFSHFSATWARCERLKCVHTFPRRLSATWAQHERDLSAMWAQKLPCAIFPFCSCKFMTCNFMKEKNMTTVFKTVKFSPQFLI